MLTVSWKDGVPPLKNLRLPYVEREGYANMRCTWVLGCPGEIQPRKAISQIEAAFEPSNDRANTEAAYAYAFQELFPDKPVPEQVGNHCGAQFALARWKVLERPKKDYIRYRDWLWKTPLEDSVSGRILEYSWHSESCPLPSATRSLISIFQSCLESPLSTVPLQNTAFATSSDYAISLAQRTVARSAISSPSSLPFPRIGPTKAPVKTASPLETGGLNEPRIPFFFRFPKIKTVVSELHL